MHYKCTMYASHGGSVESLILLKVWCSPSVAIRPHPRSAKARENFGERSVGFDIVPQPTNRFRSKFQKDIDACGIGSTACLFAQTLRGCFGLVALGLVGIRGAVFREVKTSMQK